MRLARAYKRKGNTFIVSQSQTESGFWINTGPVFALHQGAVARTEGEAVLLALTKSRSGVPDPDRSANLIQPLLDATGAKSWSSFVVGTHSVCIESDADELRFVPEDNLGAVEGFAPLNESAIALRDGASADEIGKALQRAFALSR